MPSSFSPCILSEFNATDNSFASLGLCFSSVYTCVSIWDSFAVIPWLSPFGPAAEQLQCTHIPSRGEPVESSLQKQARAWWDTLLWSKDTTESFRVSVTLLCKRKDVRLPRAPIPAWRGACTLGRVICFMWHPFCWWLAALEALLLFLPPRFLLAHYSFCLVTAQSSVAVPPCCWSFFPSIFITFCDPFSNFQP